jgi:stage IV sporulation protein FB
VHARAHFRIFGIPVRIEPFFVIVALVLGIRQQQLWLVFAFAVLVFVSILIHELGHALVYRFLGQRSAIVLHGFGGFTVPMGGGRRVLTRGKSIAVSVSGVVFQLLFLAVPASYIVGYTWQIGPISLFDEPTQWAIDTGNGWDPDDNWDFNLVPVLGWAAFINLWWAIFNMLPLRPLDGGHVAEEIVGFERACRLGVIAGIAGGLWALFNGWLFMGILMGILAYNNYRELRAGHQTGAFEVDAPETPGGRAGGPGGGGGATGRRGGRRGRRRRAPHLEPVGPSPGLGSEPPRRSGDVEAAVWNALRAGDGRRAANLLQQAGASSPNAFVQASVALAQGHDGIAVDLFEEAYLANPDGPPNLVPATLLADRDQAVTLTQALVASGSRGVDAASGLQTHLHYAERFPAAAEVGEAVFAAGSRSPAQTAFEVACSWARAGEPDKGLRWIEVAIDEGFGARGVLDGEPDLSAVRVLPDWSTVRGRLDW